MLTRRFPTLVESARLTRTLRRNRRDMFARFPGLAELLEPRVLLTAAHSAADTIGTLAFSAGDKTGSLTFDGAGAITAGSWTNPDGSTSVVDAGTGSTYVVIADGTVKLSIANNLSGNAAVTTTQFAGTINATNDVVSLNEVDGSQNPLANGLAALVNHAGTFTVANAGGTWNLSALDFRGNISVNAAGNVLAGIIYVESGKQSALVTGGGVTLNGDGTGTLTINTGFTGGFSTISLNIAMNARKDTLAGDSTTFGNGSASAEMTVLTRASGAYNPADVVGSTWTLNSSEGLGSFTFKSGNKLSGFLEGVNGKTWTLAGTSNYTLGGNGTLTVNLQWKSGTHTRRESLTGALNQSKNLMSLDRAIANGESGSHLTLLTQAANHAPTERKTAVVPGSAFQSVAVAIDYNTLLTATSATDLEHDPISFLITDVPAANGTLSITHLGSTSAVTAGSTIMQSGDTLTWVPSQTTQGQLNAFTVQATDGAASAANTSKVFVATSALPVVTIVAKKGNALEALAGQPGGNGTFQLTRAGGDLSQPLMITLGIDANAVLGVRYNVLGPDNSLLGNLNSVTFPANVSTITLTVVPIEDGAADGTLPVVATVLPDGTNASVSYLQSVHHVARVNILDSAPSVFVVPVVKSVKEGASNQIAFFVERLPAQGGNTKSVLPVNLDYSNSTFDVSHLVAPTSVTFAPGEVKKRIVISTTDDGLANPNEKIVATLVGGNFNPVAGEGSASVGVRDIAPTVRVMTNISSAQESDPTNKFGEFTVIRTGATTTSLAVNLATSSGLGFGTLGTNYMLTDASGNALTGVITIPAGATSAIVKVVPIDDGKNDPTLLAGIRVVQDAGPGYYVAAVHAAAIRIFNSNRFPTIANGTVHTATTKDTALHLSFATLISSTGAALATGETNGTLELQVGKVVAGKLRVIRSGSATPVLVTAQTVIHAGDELVWTPPAGVTATDLPAFTLFAHDGTVASLTAALFEITIT